MLFRSIRLVAGLSLLFSLLPFNSFADGCAVNYNTSTERIYYGAAPGTRNFTTPVAYNNGSGTAYPTLCPKYNFNAASRNSQTCTIVGVAGPYSYIPDPNFILVPCPIDDFIPLLLLFSGSFGFIILGRKNFIYNA